MKVSSLAALEVVILTTSSAANDDNFIKMNTFCLSVIWCQKAKCKRIEKVCKNDIYIFRTLCVYDSITTNATFHYEHFTHKALGSERTSSLKFWWWLIWITWKVVTIFMDMSGDVIWYLWHKGIILVKAIWKINKVHLYEPMISNYVKQIYSFAALSWFWAQ